ncbi:putative MFS transporter [Hyaloscypha variabilis]
MAMATDSHTWPLWWRILILINLCIYTTLGNLFAACVSPLLVVFAEEFHVSVTDTSHLPTYCVLTIGLSNLLAIPISQYIGKRYTILISMVIFMAVNIWSAYCTTFTELQASRIVGGLGAGIVEALGPLIVTECFSEGHLASAMVLYSFSLGAGASIGPVIAGLVYNGLHDWPWVFKITAIIAGVNLLTAIIMLPETTTRIPHAETASASGADVEKSSAFETEHTVQATRESLQETASLRQIWIERSFFWTLPDIKAESNFFVLFLQPFSLLTSPAVLLTSITFGVLIAFTVMISIIYSTVLSMPPMLWTPLKVGLLNLSSIIGLMIGMPTGGILADIFYRRSARRNDGMAIRESRLKALLPGAIITPVGLVLIGVVLQKHLSWVGLAFGWLMMNIGLTAVANVMLTYSVDC